MDVIYQNPFRVLGLPVTATDREIAKCISDLSIFMEMGKTKEFDCDHFFPVKPHRTSGSIGDASQKIEQPNNKLFYALFWFWENPTNTIDEMAFEELRNGNIDKAIQFWEKATNNGITTKNSSNHRNLAVLYLGLSSENGKLDKTMFLKSVSLSGKFLANSSFEDFIKHLLGSKHSIDSLKIIDSYVDEIISLAKPYLDKTDNIKTRELIKSFSSFPDRIQNDLLGKFIGKYIHNIERQIKVAESRCKENATKANKAGFELFKKTKEDLECLRTVLSESDLEFQFIADKLANEITECSICYFNKFRDSEIDPGEDALKLIKYAKNIAVEEKINERIDKNTPTIKEYVDEKPKREKLKQVKEEVNYIYGKLGELQTKKPSTLVVKTFITACRPKLNLIKDKLGKTDTDYLEICDLVVDNAVELCVVYLNTVATYAGNNRSLLLAELAVIKPAFRAIGSLDMSRSARSRYNDLCSKLGFRQTSSSNRTSFGDSCYVATMVYSSYHAPEVMVLRKFRDEVLLQSWIGRKFIRIYYQYSPSLVRKTKHSKAMHIILKSILNPFVNYLKAKYE